MPHRVATFLRPAAGHISNAKKSRSRTTSPRSGSPYASDGEENSIAVKLPEHLVEALKKTHRLSLPFVGHKKENHHHAPTANSSLALECRVESPPIVFHGNAEESTGALVSGQMMLEVKEEIVDVESFSAVLNIHITQKRPFHGHCSECQNQYTEVKTWQFLAQPTTLRRGTHQFPFSVLMPGHLPASMDTPILSIAYEFKAEAFAARSHGSPSPVRLGRVFHVKRSLPEPDFPHHSIRVFPPTNIKASAHYSSVIRPASSNKVTIKLDGLMSHNEKVKTVDLWRLKKLTWRLEETIKTIAPACKPHTPSATNKDGSVATKGLVRSEVRVLGEKHLLEGWKSDYSGMDGTLDFEFDYGVNHVKQHGGKHNKDGKDYKYACDTKSADGTQVSHSLVVEMIVSKEYAPAGKTHLATQTGTGRILRMHYAVTMSDYAGLGVSWDNEAPPVYQDVPPSPPAYPSEEQLPIYFEESPMEQYDSIEAIGSRRASMSGLLDGPLSRDYTGESSSASSSSSSLRSS